MSRGSLISRAVGRITERWGYPLVLHRVGVLRRARRVGVSGASQSETAKFAGCVRRTRPDRRGDLTALCLCLTADGMWLGGYHRLTVLGWYSSPIGFPAARPRAIVEVLFRVFQGFCGLQPVSEENQLRFYPSVRRVLGVYPTLHCGGFNLRLCRLTVHRFVVTLQTVAAHRKIFRPCAHFRYRPCSSG